MTFTLSNQERVKDIIAGLLIQALSKMLNQLEN